jgi:hypothetical protein
MTRPSWLGPDPTDVAHRKLAGLWEQMRLDKQAEAKREAAAFERNWAGLRVGDGVLLSATASQEFLTAYDDDGCVIQLDGVIDEIEVERCKVKVLLESTMAGLPAIAMTLWVAPQDVSKTEGVHVWGPFSAKVYAKQRKGETWGESPFWAD